MTDVSTFTLPEPFGDIFISPLLLVDIISLSLICMLSTSTCVVTTVPLITPDTPSTNTVESSATTEPFKSLVIDCTVRLLLPPVKVVPFKSIVLETDTTPVSATLKIWLLSVGELSGLVLL